MRLFNSQHTSYRQSIAMGAVLGSLAMGASSANAGSLNSFDQLLLDLVVTDHVQSFSFDLPMEFKPAVMSVVADNQSNSQAGSTFGTSGRFDRFEAIAFDFADTTTGNTFGSVLSGLNKSDAGVITDGVQVVPLPSAALAGMGMLAGIAGIGYLRSRR